MEKALKEEGKRRVGPTAKIDKLNCTGDGYIVGRPKDQIMGKS